MVSAKEPFQNQFQLTKQIPTDKINCKLQSQFQHTKQNEYNEIDTVEIIHTKLYIQYMKIIKLNKFSSLSLTLRSRHPELLSLPCSQYLVTLTFCETKQPEVYL